MEARIAFPHSLYAVEPGGNPEDADSALRALEAAFVGEAITDHNVKNSDLDLALRWLRKLNYEMTKAGEVQVFIERLRQALRGHGPATPALQRLLRYATIGSAKWPELPREDLRCARIVARSALKCAMPVLPENVIFAGGLLRDELFEAVEAENNRRGDNRNWLTRWKIIGPLRDLGYRLHLINIPETCLFLRAYLRHPWPEVRHTGAFWLRIWRAPSLADDAMSAIEAGLDDPVAPRWSRDLIELLAIVGNRKAVPLLESLRGTAFDQPALHRALAACSGRTGDDGSV